LFSLFDGHTRRYPLTDASNGHKSKYPVPQVLTSFVRPPYR
jgi:hypothetical protein